MRHRLATCATIAIATLSSPRLARAGCQFWSFADGDIDSDKDISGEPGVRPLVRFYLVCHDSLTDFPALNPDIGSDARSLPAGVPIMVAAHGGSGNLLSFKKDTDLTGIEDSYLMIYPQGVCDGDSGSGVVSIQRQTQTYNILPAPSWPRNIVTSCTEDLNQGAGESPNTPNAALTSASQQSQFEWRSVKIIPGDPADPEFVVSCPGGASGPCGFRVDDYVTSVGQGVDARYAESDQYAYRDLRTIAGIVAQVRARYYPLATPVGFPKKRFLGFSSGAGLGLTILKYRHAVFDGYAFAGHPIQVRFVQAEQSTPFGTNNPSYDVDFTNLGFGGYPTNIRGPEGTIATDTFDLFDVGNGHQPLNMGTGNGITLGNLDPAGINKKILFVQGSMDMANLMRISRADPADSASAGYDQPDPGDALPSPLSCGASPADSTSSAWVWQRYINHTAQFLDTTAGAVTPAILDPLTCGETGWTSVASPPILAPTSTLATCGDFGYDPASCGTDLINTNYVYEFGSGNIKMIIPATGGHSFPRVLGTTGGAIGVNKGNEIRDFSLAQEACIWFGDGCVREVGY